MRSSSMERKREIIMLARITLLNPTENTHSHDGIIVIHITVVINIFGNQQEGVNLYFKGISL